MSYGKGYGLLLLTGCNLGDLTSRVTDLYPDQSLEASLDVGQHHTYRLSLEPAEYVRVQVQQQGMDVLLELASPKKEVLAVVDSPNGVGGVETVSAVASDGGSYLLFVRSHQNAAEVGRYGIQIVDLRPATHEDRRRVRAEHAFAAAENLLRDGHRESLAKAIAKYQDAVVVWRQLDDHHQLADSLYRMGVAYARSGNRLEAGNAYRQALDLFTQLGDLAQQAILENRLGWVEARTGNPQAAIRHHRRAENLFRALGNEKGIVAALTNLGAAFTFLGEIQNAIETYREALATCRALQDIRREANVRVSLGSLMLKLDRLDLARGDLERALEIYRALGDQRLLAVALKWLADVASQEERLDEALDFITESLEIRRQSGVPRDQAVALNTLGNIYWKLGESAAALAAHQQALEFRQHGPATEAATTLLALARLHADARRVEKAQAHYQQALERFLETGDRHGEAASRRGLARVSSDLGDFDEARRQIDRAVGLVEGLRTETASFTLRRSYRDFRQEYYELQIEVLMRLAEEATDPVYEVEAFEAAEQSRGQALLEAITASRRASERRQPEPWLERRSQLHRQLKELIEDESGAETREPAVARLLVELEELEVSSAGPVFDRLPALDRVQLRELQEQLLDEDALILAFALGERRSFLWLVSRHDFSSYVLPPAAELRSLIAPAHRALQRASRDQQQDAQLLMRRLSEALLAPVAHRLGEKRLLIVADDALHLLPFGALPDPRSPAGSTARRLIETHEIVSVPSLSVLTAIRRRLAERKPSPGLLAMVADPIFALEDPRLAPDALTVPTTTPIGTHELLRSARDLGLDEFRRLPYSGQEADAILRLAKGAVTLQALGLAAHRERILGGALTDYRILHFATHGLLHSRLPELSGLVLSLVDEQGRTQDGFLRAFEIAALDLPAELVVLSACRTGLGQQSRGEGLVGLSHAFLNAGASRIVVSLWNVGDRSTAELMRRFYRQLLRHGRTPAAALRSAQLSMLREDAWALPRHWAGFILQGDWRGFNVNPQNQGDPKNGSGNAN